MRSPPPPTLVGLKRRQSYFCYFGQRTSIGFENQPEGLKERKERSFVNADSHTSDFLMARQQSPAHTGNVKLSRILFFFLSSVSSFGVSLMIIDW
jgi:hypothetical protein